MCSWIKDRAVPRLRICILDTLDFKCWGIRRGTGCIAWATDSNMLPLRNALIGRACLPAIKVTAAEGFFFFGLFRPTRSRLIWATLTERKEVRHVFKDSPIVFRKNRVRRRKAERLSNHAPLSRKRATRRSILVSSRNSADTSADLRTLSVWLEETARKEDSLWGKFSSDGIGMFPFYAVFLGFWSSGTNIRLK